MATLIKLEDVHKIYHLDGIKVPAINGISLSINKGDFVALIGPSGSGKSTIIKMLSGLYYPSEGRMLVNNIDSRRLGSCFSVFENCINALKSFGKQLPPNPQPAFKYCIIPLSPDILGGFSSH